MATVDGALQRCSGDIDEGLSPGICAIPLEALHFETFGSPKVVRRKLGLVAGLSILLALLALPLSFFDNGASMDFAGRDDGCRAMTSKALLL